MFDISPNHNWKVYISGLHVVVALLALASSARSAEPEYDLIVPKGVEVGTLLIHPDNRENLPQSTPFDIDPDGLPIVAKGSALVALGSSRPLGSSDPLPIDDFAWMRNRGLLLITKNHLASVGSEGLTPILDLQDSGMRVRPAGQHTAYLFGGPKEPRNHNVYLVSRDGSLTDFIDLPAPISDVVGDGEATYVATGNTILRVAADHTVTPFLQASDEITSIALAPDIGLFYATRFGVGYAASTGTGFEFMRGKSGILRVWKSSLFVLIPEGPHLVRLSAIEAFEAVASQPSSPSAESTDEQITKSKPKSKAKPKPKPKPSSPPPAPSGRRR